MDSDQDIATELEKLNIELTEIAAAEDIYLTATENSPSSDCGPADGQRQDFGAFVALCQRQAGVSLEQPPRTMTPSSQIPAQHMLQQSSTVKQLTPADVEQRDRGHSTLRGIAGTQVAGTDVTRRYFSPGQMPAAVNAQSKDLSAASTALQPPAQPHETDAARPQPQDPQQPQQAMLLQQLLEQHGKLLDLLQVLAVNSNSNCRHNRRKRHLTPAPEDSSSNVSSGDTSRDDARYIAVQEQYQSQLLDNHQLKKRINKVQKVLLHHLQEARQKAAAAEAAAEGAQRREQQAQTAAAALQTQVMQQQEHLQRQQLEITTLRDQLQQVQQLHKRKLVQIRAELKQRFDAQLQETTAAYAQELSQIQAHLAGSRKRTSSSKPAMPSTKATAEAGSAVEDVGGLLKVHTAAVGGTAARRPGPPKHDAAVGSSSSSRVLGADACSEMLTSTPDEGPAADEDATEHRPWTTGICSTFADPQQQQQQPQGSQEMNVPAEVMQYAERYQQGAEGTCRPPTAPPSVLQRRRQQEQPVPEAAAQLAQHFVAGGEGISRPLTAPSSDRCSLLPRRSGSPPPWGGPQPTA